MEMGIVAPRASWCEIFQRKTVSLQKRKKSPRNQNTKRGHFKRGKEGDILKEL
jgi:hypothetical protein